MLDSIKFMIPQLSEELIARFWSRIDSREEEECWNWKGTVAGGRYGVIRYKRKNIYAHRLAYYLDTGEQPNGCVCHRCDNMLCCNPKHLFLGTHRDNQLDKVQKGRQAKGERNGKAVHTEEIVLGVKKMLSKGKKFKEIQDRYNLATSTIMDIKSGRTWGWLKIN